LTLYRNRCIIANRGQKIENDTDSFSFVPASTRRVHKDPGESGAVEQRERSGGSSLRARWLQGLSIRRRWTQCLLCEVPTVESDRLEHNHFGRKGNCQYASPGLHGDGSSLGSEEVIAATSGSSPPRHFLVRRLSVYRHLAIWEYILYRKMF
jgi:hypothetical protein